MRILITGCAGFIGYHLSKELLHDKKNKVFGIDNMSDYYDIKLKKDRLKILKKEKNFFYTKIDISNKKKVNYFYKLNKFQYVVHLAAQAGVRFSLTNPYQYISSNINGFFNILDASKNKKIVHFIYASTSSVYGNAKKFPLKESDDTDKPLSFYAASKKSNEVMAHAYSNIYKLPTTGVRFFTVYGEYGRPDMAPYKFTDALINNKELEIFNYGDHIRDFTHVSDVVNALIKLIKFIPKEKIPYKIYNIGSSNPNSIKYFLSIIQNIIRKKANLKYLPLQKGDVHKTFADTSQLINKIKFKVKIDLEKGIAEYIKWFKSYY
jgi:UDP-glucuronate 4-epimerase